MKDSVRHPTDFSAVPNDYEGEDGKASAEPNREVGLP